MTEYEYISRAYGLNFFSNDDVMHSETGRYGRVIDPCSSQQHYVLVDFGDDAPRLCHPQSLKILAHAAMKFPGHNGETKGEGDGRKPRP